MKTSIIDVFNGRNELTEKRVEKTENSYYLEERQIDWLKEAADDRGFRSASAFLRHIIDEERENKP